ncbi:MAG: carbohydrate ABC transporter permease, partial [Armatimonadota bacterium]
MQCPGCQTEVPDGLKQCPFCSAELTAAPMAAPAAPARGRRRWREAVTAYLFLLPNIVGFLMFTLGPVFAAFALSFVRWDAVRPIEKAKFVGLDNYRQFLGWERDESTGDVRANDDRFWTYSYNTIYLMGGIPVGMALSLLLALLLNTKLRGVVVYRTIYFLPSICSMVAVALLWKWLYNTDFGLLNAGLRAIDDKVGVLSWTF